MKSHVLAYQFTPTECNSVEDKAWFGNYFLRLAEAGEWLDVSPDRGIQ